MTEEAEISLSPFTGNREAWNGAKFYLSPHMCDSEIVRTLFGASRQAEEYELREWFKFKNRNIYNLHRNVHVLVDIAKFQIRAFGKMQ